MMIHNNIEPMKVELVSKTKNIKLAAFDLDGTTLYKGQIQKNVGETLLRLKEKGIILAISSGRDISPISPEVKQYFSYAITGNGACVGEITNSIINPAPFFTAPMEPKSIFEAIKLVHKSKGHMCLYCNGFVIASISFIVNLLRKKEYRTKGNRKSLPKKSGKISFGSKRSAKKNLQKKHGIFKIQTFYKKEENGKKGSALLKKVNGIDFTTQGLNSQEIMAQGVNKGSALEILCDYLDIKTEQTIVFGDSGNDIDILKKAGIAVVMGNGEEIAKKEADYITDTVENDGVASAINKLFF